MKRKLLNLFLLLSSLEGLVALAIYLTFPAEEKSSLPFSQSPARLALAGVLLLIILALGILWLLRTQKKDLASQLLTRLDEKLESGRDLLFVVSASSLTLAIFMVEAFFLSFIFLPPFIRPITLWMFAFFLQMWIFLRIAYPSHYHSIGSILRSKWRAWTKIQQRTSLILLAILVLYFCAFIPVNYYGIHEVDDTIQYPIAIITLTRGDTFSSSVYHFLVNESSAHGHQYVTLQALSLLPSRILYGEAFGEQAALNLLFLRQFMCVLFSALSMFLLTYIITRFKNFWVAGGLFLLLLSIPGMVKFNMRFLHPDALVLFCIVLTIYFLQRDNFTYRRDFFFAAFTTSLAITIKLWGLFFVFPVGLYLILGLAQKRLSFKRALLSGLGFVLMLVVTAIVTNPGQLMPSVTQQLINSLVGQVNNKVGGYGNASTIAEYAKDFPTWMRVFETHYMQEFYFFLCFGVLIVYLVFGQRKWLSEILLSWCIPLTLFFIYFVAAKSYWWLMEALIPLYPAPFLIFVLAEEKENWLPQRLLARPWAKALVVGVIAVLCGIQFVINVIKVIALVA